MNEIKSSADFFTKELAELYDERNQRLAAISQNMHFLISLILETLPERARILSVGAGTGAEILMLAKTFPNWNFVAVEPSQAMLDVARERIRAAGYADRCELVHGFAHELPREGKFDAALALLVGHFIKREERTEFYQELVDRVRPGGIVVNTEISFDFDSPALPYMMENWKTIQRIMGATPESLAALPQQMREMLSVLPPTETEVHMRSAGLSMPIKFFQSFMICGWYGVVK